MINYSQEKNTYANFVHLQFKHDDPRGILCLDESLLEDIRCLCSVYESLRALCRTKGLNTAIIYRDPSICALA